MYDKTGADEPLYLIEVDRWSNETAGAYLILTSVGTVHWIPKVWVISKSDLDLIIPRRKAVESGILRDIKLASKITT